MFWEDFAADTRLGQFGNEFTRTWLQGDLHVENFGAFGNDEGEVVYDINDYDEAVIADYQYDLWRMAVSIVLVARQDDNTKLSDKDQAEVIDAFASSYLDQLRSYVKKDGSEDTMVFDASNTDGPLAAFLKDPKKKRSRVKMLDDWTELAGGGRRFDLAGSKGKLVDVSDSRRSEILQGIGEYEATLVKRPKNHRSGYFEVKDVARRLLAGTGSLGVQRFYVLIAGADHCPRVTAFWISNSSSDPPPITSWAVKIESSTNGSWKNTLAGMPGGTRRRTGPWRSIRTITWAGWSSPMAFTQCESAPSFRRHSPPKGWTAQSSWG